MRNNTSISQVKLNRIAGPAFIRSGIDGTHLVSNPVVWPARQGWDNSEIRVGLSWEAVFETWRLSAFPGFLKIDGNNPDIIWSGGATNIFSPHLVKSIDGGANWTRLNEEFYFNTDAGQSWETVYEGLNTRTLAHSARKLTARSFLLPAGISATPGKRSKCPTARLACRSTI